jgi:DNA-binding response OmpR family regulator
VREVTVKVLVADDDPDILGLVVMRLRREGYEVVEARDGAEALALVALHQPAVLLLDVGMPDLDGYEVIRRLRAEAATAGLPILVVTARDRHEVDERGIAAGANGYLRKPFTSRELREGVAAVLRDR